MKKGFLLFALLVTVIGRVPAADAQQRTRNAEPTLEVTLGWIKEKINLYREVSIANARGAAMTETYEVTRVNGCRLELQHIETEEGLKVSTVYQLPLHDYAGFSTANCLMFTIATHRSSVAYVQKIEGDGNRNESSSGVADHVVIFTRRKDLDNCDLHKRLKKAFDHAGELCEATDEKSREQVGGRQQ